MSAAAHERGGAQEGLFSRRPGAQDCGKRGPNSSAPLPPPPPCSPIVELPSLGSFNLDDVDLANISAMLPMPSEDSLNLIGNDEALWSPPQN